MYINQEFAYFDANGCDFHLIDFNFERGFQVKFSVKLAKECSCWKSQTLRMEPLFAERVKARPAARYRVGYTFPMYFSLYRAARVTFSLFLTKR